MFLCVILLLLRFFWGAAILFGLWYVLYGFVGLAHFFSLAREVALSNIFLTITLYPTLLPFRKAFYFWTKSVNIVLKNSTDIEKASTDTAADAEKALLLAKKVNIDDLYTENNKAMFLSYLVSLYLDLGDKEQAHYYIQEARKMPHKKAIDETLNHIYDEITK